MLIETLDILRCPFCGGRLSLVESEFHHAPPGSLQHGILGCHCCVFPVIDGIPVLHLQPTATTARDQVQAGRPDLARRTMFGVEDDGRADAIDAVASAPDATYREAVEATALDHLPATTLPDGLADLARRRVLLDLSEHYH